MDYLTAILESVRGCGSFDGQLATKTIAVSKLMREGRLLTYEVVRRAGKLETQSW